MLYFQIRYILDSWYRSVYLQYICSDIANQFHLVQPVQCRPDSAAENNSVLLQRENVF